MYWRGLNLVLVEDKWGVCILFQWTEELTLFFIRVFTSASSHAPALHSLFSLEVLSLSLKTLVFAPSLSLSCPALIDDCGQIAIRQLQPDTVQVRLWTGFYLRHSYAYLPKTERQQMLQEQR